MKTNVMSIMHNNKIKYFFLIFISAIFLMPTPLQSLLGDFLVSLIQQSIPNEFLFILELELVVLAIMFFIMIFKNEIQAELINFIKVVAMFMVFILHTSNYVTYAKGIASGSIFSNAYMRFLYMPAYSAVAVFFFLSGYLTISSLSKHEFSLHSVLNFYKKKLLNVFVPTTFIIILMNVFVYPDFLKNHSEFLALWFMLKYRAWPGTNAIGVTWYISTLMSLYILAPLIFFVIQKMNKKLLQISFFIILIAGFLYRLRGHMLSIDWAIWQEYTYMPFDKNLDLFILGGIIYKLSKQFNYLQVSKQASKQAITTVFVYILMFYIVFNALTYHRYWNFIIGPSIYALILSGMLLFYDRNNFMDIAHKWKCKETISYLASISFYFYLFHSLVLENLYKFMPVAFNNINLLYFQFLIVAGIITTILASIFTYGVKRI